MGHAVAPLQMWLLPLCGISSLLHYVNMSFTCHGGSFCLFVNEQRCDRGPLCVIIVESVFPLKPLGMLSCFDSCPFFSGRRTMDCGRERWPLWPPRTLLPWWARPWGKRVWAPVSWHSACSSLSLESSLASWPCRDTDRQSTVIDERLACSGRRVSNTATGGGLLGLCWFLFLFSFFFFFKKKQNIRQYHDGLSGWKII